MKKLVVVLVSLLLVSACSAGSGAQTPIKTIDAEIDYENHEVILPIDPFLITQQEYQLNAAAIYLDTELCMGEKGHPVFWADPEKYPYPFTNDRYPEWDVEFAAEFGLYYEHLTSSEDLWKWQEDNAAAIETDAYKADFDECTERGDFKGPIFTFVEGVESKFPAELDGISFKSFDHMMSSDDGIAAIEDWKSCLTENGLEHVEMEDSIGGIEPLSESRRSEEDIKRAIASAQCAVDTRLTEKLAAIEAAYQSPLVAKYENELVEIRGQVDELIELSREYIQSHRAELEQYKKQG